MSLDGDAAAVELLTSLSDEKTVTQQAATSHKMQPTDLLMFL